MFDDLDLPLRHYRTPRHYPAVRWPLLVAVRNLRDAAGLRSLLIGTEAAERVQIIVATTFDIGMAEGPTGSTPQMQCLQGWIANHIAETLTVEQMAAYVHMSPRNFARVFRREFGMPPGRYVEAVRVEAALKHLLDPSKTMELVAEASGFGSTTTLRRAFERTCHTTPRACRDMLGRRAVSSGVARTRVVHVASHAIISSLKVSETVTPKGNAGPTTV